MLKQEKKRTRRTYAFALDMIHIIIGILIVVLSVLAFLNPEDNMILFPIIFLLAAILNFLNGFERFHNSRGQKKKRTSGMTLMIIGAALFLLCIISTITIWWG